MARQKLDWQDIDIGSLNAKQAKAYEAYKTAYKAYSECKQAVEMRERRDAFEKVMQEGVAKGYRLAVNFMWGKLSTALVPIAKATTKPKLTLAEYLKRAQASGVAT